MTNNKIFTAILALAFIFTAGKAAAECDGFYLAGRAGYAEYEVDDDRSGVGNGFSHYIVDKKRFIASGGIGYRHEHFRTEIEYMWRKANSENISSYAKENSNHNHTCSSFIMTFFRIPGYAVC